AAAVWLSDGSWFFPLSTHHSLLSLGSRGGKGLALFAAHLLFFIADAFAFIRLRFPHAAHLGGKLADSLLVGTFDHDGGRIRQLDGNAVGRIHGDRIRIAGGKNEG